MAQERAIPVAHPERGAVLEPVQGPWNCGRIRTSEEYGCNLPMPRTLPTNFGQKSARCIAVVSECNEFPKSLPFQAIAQRGESDNAACPINALYRPWKRKTKTCCRNKTWPNAGVVRYRLSGCPVRWALDPNTSNMRVRCGIRSKKFKSTNWPTACIKAGAESGAARSG